MWVRVPLQSLKLYLTLIRLGFLKVTFSRRLNSTPFSFIFPEKLIQYQYNFTQLLTTYIKEIKCKKCSHHLLYANAISLLATRKMSKIQKKKWQKQLILTKKIFPSSNNLRNSNEIFRKSESYDNIKSRRKPGLCPFSRK